MKCITAMWFLWWWIFFSTSTQPLKGYYFSYIYPLSIFSLQKKSTATLSCVSPDLALKRSYPWCFQSSEAGGGGWNSGKTVPLCTVQGQRSTPSPDTDGKKNENLLNNCLIYFSGLNKTFFYLGRVNVVLLRKSEKRTLKNGKDSERNSIDLNKVF